MSTLQLTSTIMKVGSVEQGDDTPTFMEAHCGASALRLTHPTLKELDFLAWFKKGGGPPTNRLSRLGKSKHQLSKVESIDASSRSANDGSLTSRAAILGCAKTRTRFT